jgi:hypothetical protein
VQYNTNGGGGRPPITAAAIACLFNAGEYDDKFVPNLMQYCEKNMGNNYNDIGSWHYAHYYWAQVKYRQGGKEWEEYRNKLFKRIISEQSSDGSWNGQIGKVYITSINLTILQLESGALPIYMK